MASELLEAKLLVADQAEITMTAELGKVQERHDIRSTVGPFRILPEYRIVYPEGVVLALTGLYAEYNRAFSTLVELNREWESDYQHCLSGGTPINYAVQIDMVGLTPEWLGKAATMPVADVKEVLRGRIFEIENSLAMYQFMEEIFARGLQPSVFKQRFLSSLDELRARHGKQIALLAVTDQKYQAMRTTEFGKVDGELLSREEVRQMSGFDAFLGPSDFRQHVEENGGKCQYLLYARTSDPVAKLKQPDLVVDHPLLGDSTMRRIIKACTLTFNIDAPDMEFERRINDTKEYAVPMQIAFPANSLSAVLAPDLVTHLARGKAFAAFDEDRLAGSFKSYLAAQGVEAAQAQLGTVTLRGKPMKGAYGCYGHVRGELLDNRFRNSLRSGIRKRGAYVIQPEMPVPVIVNQTDGQAYTCIDRNLLAWTNGQPCFLGGFRSLMPVDSVETREGRNHGNGLTVWAEIV